MDPSYVIIIFIKSGLVKTGPVRNIFTRNTSINIQDSVLRLVPA